MRPMKDGPAGRRGARRQKAAGATLALTALALLATGCGGNSPSGSVAHLGSSSSSTGSSSGSSASGTPQAAGSGGGESGTQVASKAVAYANCIRAHGVPGYPDPKVSTHGDGVSVAVAALPGPKFKAAQQACRKLMPGGGPGSSQDPVLSSAEQAQVLQAVACIRKHGEPDLPDPTFSGGGAHLPPTVNTHTDTFKAAEQACQSLFPARLRAGGH